LISGEVSAGNLVVFKAVSGLFEARQFQHKPA
jgi:hypothetical protein